MGVRDVARLDRELDAVLGARPRDPKACADVLERAAFACRTDPAAAEQWVEAELLDELVDCYEALGRVDEAITVMRRALQVGWAGEPDGRCRIAELLMRDGRVAAGHRDLGAGAGRHPRRCVAVQQRRRGIRGDRRPRDRADLAHPGPAAGDGHR